jgi:uncharacterized protein with von Willebrand factor type A (vWA) domain
VRAVLTEFLREVRASGIPVSLAEGIDALRAACAVGVERERLRDGLAAAIVKDEVDRPAFDEAFDRFFALTDVGRRKSKRAMRGAVGAGAGRRGEARNHEPQHPEIRGDPPRIAPPPREAGRERRSAERAREIERRLRRRALLAKPFRALQPPEAAALVALAEDLARRFRGRLRRRLRPARRRGRLDFRRTLRRSIGHGGVPLDIELRRRRPGRIDLVALCDVSGSVRHATDFFAALLGPCQDLLRSLRLLVFVDHAIEATIEDGKLVPHAPVDVHAYSDLGQVLVEIERGDLAPFGRNTLLLVLGDARNNRRPARADVLGRLRARVRAVWWLMAEESTRWGTADSAIEAYRPHCDLLLECADGAGLLTALDRVGR